MPSRQNQEGAPRRHAHGPSSHTVTSQVFSCQDSRRGLFHCRMGVHFHYCKTGSSPFSPIQDQAAKLFSGLQFVQMQNEGGGPACYGDRTAVAADHRQSKRAWSQVARGCVALTSCGTSLGRSLLIPKARLTPPTSQLWSNPAHMANGHLGQSGLP